MAYYWGYNILSGVIGLKGVYIFLSKRCLVATFKEKKWGLKIQKLIWSELLQDEIETVKLLT